MDHFNEINDRWNITYSAYIDDLILTSPNFYAIPETSKKFQREANDIVTGYNGDALIYIKFEEASNHFGDDIEKNDKRNIINKVKELAYA